MWLSDTGYQCGTTIDKYIYTHSLTLTEKGNDNVLLPPGECVNQLGNCTWSSKYGYYSMTITFLKFFFIHSLSFMAGLVHD